MRLFLKATLVGFVLASVQHGPAMAPTPSPQSYDAITDRNLFGLRPAPVAEQPVPAVPQLPKLLLTGITTILGNKIAFLKTQPTAGKPGEQAKEESLMLAEGQRQGPVEVLNIDEHAGKVRVNNSGSVVTLTFEKDAPKPAPSLPPTPGGPNPAVAGAAGLQPSGLGPSRVFPSYRTLTPTGNVSGTGMAATNPAMSLPPVPGTATTAPQIPSPVGQLTPEQQQILTEIQEQLNRDNQRNVPVSPRPQPQPGTFPVQTPRARP